MSSSSRPTRGQHGLGEGVRARRVELLDEERVAARPGVQLARERRGNALAGERGELARHVVGCQRRQLDPAHDRPPRQLGREPAQLAERARRRRGRWRARPAAPRAGCGLRKASSASVERSAHWMSSSTSRTGPRSCAEPAEQLEHELVQLGGGSAGTGRLARQDRRQRAAGLTPPARRAARTASRAGRSAARRAPARRPASRRRTRCTRRAGPNSRRASTSATRRVLPMPASPPSRITAGRRRECVLEFAQRRVTSDQRPVPHTAIISDRCRHAGGLRV